MTSCVYRDAGVLQRTVRWTAATRPLAWLYARIQQPHRVQLRPAAQPGLVPQPAGRSAGVGRGRGPRRPVPCDSSRRHDRLAARGRRRPGVRALPRARVLRAVRRSPGRARGAASVRPRARRRLRDGDRRAPDRPARRGHDGCRLEPGDDHRCPRGRAVDRLVDRRGRRVAAARRVVRPRAVPAGPPVLPGSRCRTARDAARTRAGRPAGPLSALGEATHAALVRDFTAALAPYADEDGIAFPMETTVVTAANIS
jgi:hypothetical protein